MSQKSQADQHKTSVVASEAAAETLPSVSPIVMITATSDVYVTDRSLTKWEKVNNPDSNGDLP
jgi:hypothetical protein